MHRLSDGEREVLRECERDAEAGVMADYRAALADLRQLLDDPIFDAVYAAYLAEDDGSLLRVMRDRAEEMGLTDYWEMVLEEIEQHHGLIHCPF